MFRSDAMKERAVHLVTQDEDASLRCYRDQLLQERSREDRTSWVIGIAALFVSPDLSYLDARWSLLDYDQSGVIPQQPCQLCDIRHPILLWLRLP